MKRMKKSEVNELLRQANEIVAKYGLRAEILPGAWSVGVQGDERTYTPVIIVAGKFPGHEILSEISTALTNNLKINRITYDLSPSTPERF